MYSTIQVKITNNYVHIITKKLRSKELVRTS
ncbi:hypothetical protein LIBO111022_15775 [Listeria booriae]|nr:Uncharacterised protein [Listeria booriae]